MRSWQLRALRLGELLPKERLHAGVARWADGRPSREPWAAAFSGGADSLALLLLLWAHWPDRRSRLFALHFDHGLRGAASRADARFCAAVCRGLGLPLAASRWRRPPPSPGEAAARDARHGFFRRALARRRCAVLWLGHQRDDVAETLLMRLGRGSGAAGLSAPRPLQEVGSVVRARPLLTLSKEDLAAALSRCGIPWREDATNAADRHHRNRVRRNVLPSWKRAVSETGEGEGRDALAGAARTRELLEEDDAALEAWVGSLGAVTPGGALSLRRIEGLPRAVVRRALHRWLLRQRAVGRLSARGFEALLDAAIAGKRTKLSLGRRSFASIQGAFLRLVG